ncbi:glycosyltransferase family 2 protein [Bordetella avium]|uniref:Glycosyl transferase n=1 Tax=Bordetella avium (strain 197N) TaxID=360910 RepID=Q2L334_BORA1|nr:glycosyltransferase family 2 protein [Bordetella avium]AZY48730.1 glycosyltransferase [Bordetella avium]AZY52109.1 glycosyltransferase [Bordetella avium]RIQ14036.1 glycosyltransferase [Bordetella avium]RIQ39735.1 glycosyltransferase [Bordetella avium]RIQ44533.1 glycosyltransferase [Bordetella avium]
MRKKISIVTPLFNEEENVVELCERIAAVMRSQPYDYEHLCIDNCSTDRTVSILRDRAGHDPHLKIIVNARNFGYVRSSFHALLQASGDAAVLIASDLQDPPEIIAEFIKKWEAGYKSVMAIKPVSEESSLMFAVRKLYYKTIGRISEVPLVPNATGSGLFDRKVLDILLKLKDPYPYFRGLVCEIGYPIATVPFKQPRRLRGVTSQNFYSLYDMAMLGITKHSKVPLRLMTLCGFGLASLSLLVAIGYFLAKLFFWNSFNIGTAPLVIGLFFFSAVQMIFLGMIGEYIGAIQTQVRDLPLVVESERINFDTSTQPQTTRSEPD